MSRKKKRVYRGLAPAADKVRDMDRDGYGPPAVAAARFKVSASAVYTWAKTGKLEPVDGKPGFLKVGANLWVLFAAVARRTGIPAAASG
jgi:hypothetical protein